VDVEDQSPGVGIVGVELRRRDGDRLDLLAAGARKPHPAGLWRGMALAELGVEIGEPRPRILVSAIGGEVPGRDRVEIAPARRGKLSGDGPAGVIDDADRLSPPLEPERSLRTVLEIEPREPGPALVGDRREQRLLAQPSGPTERPVESRRDRPALAVLENEQLGRDVPVLRVAAGEREPSLGAPRRVPDRERPVGESPPVGPVGIDRVQVSRVGVVGSVGVGRDERNPTRRPPRRAQSADPAVAAVVCGLEPLGLAGLRVDHEQVRRHLVEVSSAVELVLESFGLDRPAPLAPVELLALVVGGIPRRDDEPIALGTPVERRDALGAGRELTGVSAPLHVERPHLGLGLAARFVAGVGVARVVCALGVRLAADPQLGVFLPGGEEGERRSVRAPGWAARLRGPGQAVRFARAVGGDDPQRGDRLVFLWI